MPDWVLQVAGYAAMGAGMYAGIRYDLGRLSEKAEAAARAAAKAHERLDVLMMGARRAG